MQSFGRGSSAVLQEYLLRVRRRLQFTVASRGVGATAVAALLLTVLCVWILNRFAFSDGSVISGRMVLFGGVIGVLIYALVRPLRGLGGKQTAEHLERSVPAFGGRMETYLDTTEHAAKDGGAANPLADLLAEDTLRVAESAPAEFVVDSKKILSYTAAALAGVLMLVWMGSSGPGYWGYGTSRLWGGWMKPKVSPLYQIIVEPGKTNAFDSFQWQPIIHVEKVTSSGATTTQPSGRPRTKFTFAEEFRGPPPAPQTPWEMLAQVLLMSNEFVFVD